MLVIRLVTMSLLLAAASPRGSAQVIGVEGAVELFRTSLSLRTSIGDDGSRAAVATAAAASYYWQVADLRSYYGIRVEGHYGRLKNLRDETPERTYQGTVATLAAWRVFPLDLNGDCDCPTWGDESWMKKAFFIEVGLGYGHQYVDNPRFGRWGDPGGFDATRGGGVYLARIGVAQRLTRSLDAYLALGGHGLIGRDVGYGKHSAALRPALGVSYRL